MKHETSTTQNRRALGAVRYSRAAGVAGILACSAFVLTNGRADAAVGGPDAYGYRYIDSVEVGGPTPAFRDASAGGTALNLGGNGTATISLPFPVSAYGVVSNKLVVGANGGLYVGTTSGDVPDANGPLDPVVPVPPTDAPFLAPQWADLDQGSGNVYWKIDAGEAVITWKDVDDATFEVVLTDGSNDILFQYQSTSAGSPVVGIRGTSAGQVLDYPGSAEAVLFTLDEGIVPAPSATSILPADGLTGPTNADEIDYIVTFDQPVDGVTPDDFEVQTPEVTVVTPPGGPRKVDGSLDTAYAVVGSVEPLTDPDKDGLLFDTWVVHLVEVQGSGPLCLDLLDNDTIVNMLDIPLGGTGSGNGDALCGGSVMVDNMPPSWVDIFDVLVECQLGGVTYPGPSTPPPPTAVDNVTPNPVVTFDPPLPIVLLSGDIVMITGTATDEAGNSRSCQYFVETYDTTPPEVGCQDAILELGPDGTVALSPDMFLGTPFDNCDGDEISVFLSDYELTCADMVECPTEVPILAAAVDTSGNMTVCESWVVLSDPIPPTIVCQDITVSADANGLASVSAWDVIVNYSDNCGVVDVQPDVAQRFSCYDSPASIVVTVSDLCGNTATCEATVTVIDDMPPVVVCKDATVSLDENGEYLITEADVVGSLNDNCDREPTLDFQPPVVDCEDAGTTVSVTVTATDASGNSSTCASVVTVVDDTPPTAQCKNIPALVLDDNGQATITPADIDDGSYDNCAVVDLSLNKTDFTCADVGQNVVILTVTDSSGLTSSCVALVDVQDNTPPTALCKDITLEIGPDGIVCITPADIDAGSIDNCGIAGIRVVPECFDCAQVGPNTVTLYVLDVNGNQSTCEATVTVEDNIPPVIVSCPPDLEVDAALNACEADVQLPPTAWTDNCPEGVTVEYDPPSGIFPVGDTTVTVTVTDAGGNTATCSFVVTVHDITPPVLNCPEVVWYGGTVVGTGTSVPVPGPVPTDPGKCSARVFYSVQFWDDCDQNAKLTVTNGYLSGAEFPLGETLVCLLVTDASGNQTRCCFTVIVEDMEPPIVTCPDPTDTLPADDQCLGVTPDYTVGLDPVDNCSPAGAISVVQTPAPGDPVGNDETVSIVVTDAAGNETVCEVLITLIDTTPPVITCPPDMTVECSDTNGDRFPVAIATAIDNCDPDPVITSTDVVTPGDCPQASVITRTWKATDESGNSATCDQIITVVDTTPPIIECPPNVTVECDQPTDPSATGEATAIDNCGTATVSFEDTIDPSCAGSGVIVRTWTAKDECGNVSSCVQIITVVDRTAPDITCPADVTVECDQPVDPSATGEATAIDACDPNPKVYWTDTATPGSCPQERTITRTWSASDDCGNVATCDQIITVVDTTAPEITCPVDVTVECYESTDPDATGWATADDVCDPQPGIDYSDRIIDGDCPQEKLILRTWTATDACGNVATCDQLISVVDTMAPDLVCPPDIQVECTGDTSPDVTGMAKADDRCDDLVDIDWSDSSVAGCGNTETITRTWIATDDCGNVATCDQIIKVVDSTPPVIECPPNVTVECTDPTDPSATGEAVGTDTCGAVTISHEDLLDLSCGGAGVIIRTWTATDECGNSSTCRQIITIEDTTAPTILCPADVTVECTDPTDPTATGEATAEDTCGDILYVRYTDASVPGCGNTETITRTWIAEDECGNTATCDQIITVVDTTPPTIECPPDATVECYESTDPQATGMAAGQDACGEVTITYEDIKSAGDCPQAYTIVRVWTATDECNNSDTCVQVISVVDTMEPVIICPADATVECTGDTSPAATGMAFADDRCDDDVAIDWSDESTPGCGNTETIARTWIATDDCGNTSTCIQTITVVDTTPPAITCPDPVTVECTDSTDPSVTGEATGTDTCGAVSISYEDQFDPSCGRSGTLVRIWTATDDCGNTAACTQVITIVDTTKPDILCPADITVECTDPTDPSATGAATASDTCGDIRYVRYTDVSEPGCGNTETITRTWIAEDECGNTATCEQIITVVDTTPPDIVCPPDATVECDASVDPDATGFAGAKDTCGEVEVTYADESAPGDCPQAKIITRTWMAEDECGNTATCVQTIMVVDTTPPDVICPPDIDPILVDDLCQGLVPDVTGLVQASDACGAVTLTQSPAAGSVVTFADNPLYIVVTATDECGNQSECTTTAVVVDQTPPVITCPEDMIVPIPPGIQKDIPDCGTEVTWELPKVEDNCDAAPTIIQTSGPAPGDFLIIGPIYEVCYTATDASGNASSCCFTIEVVDINEPEIFCPDPNLERLPGETDAEYVNRGGVLIVFPEPPGSCTANITYRVEFRDNCDQDVVLQKVTGNYPAVPQPDGTFTQSGLPLGESTIVWMVTDGVGNTATCAFTVNVEDDVAPTIECPGDITVPTQAGLDCAAIVDFPDPIAKDNCTDNPTIIQVEGLPSGSAFPVGTTTNVFIAIDEAGNEAECSFDVTVTDGTAPEIVGCPGEMTVELGADCCAVIPDILSMLTITDDCSTPEAEQRPAAGTEICGHGTQIVVTVVAWDESGNQSVCTTLVTAVDVTGPSIICPSDIEVCNDPEVCGAKVQYSDPLVDDNCSTDALRVVCDPPSGSYFPVGTTTVTCVVEDIAGNTAECTFNVTVNDCEAPYVDCPPDIDRLFADENCMAKLPDYTVDLYVWDNCSTPTVVQDPPAGTMIPLGDTTVTLTISDDAGNVAGCQIVVTVMDITPPTATGCPDGPITLSLDENCEALVPDIAGQLTIIDNCDTDILVVQNPPAGTVLSGDGASALVTVTATDSAPNSTIVCMVEVTAIDDTPPELICVDGQVCLDPQGVAEIVPEDIIGNLSDNCGEVRIVSVTPSTVDCTQAGTTVPVEIVARDAVGNESSCTAYVFVDDCDAPSISCQDETVCLDGDTIVVPVSDVASAFDNCGSELSPAEFTFACADLGANVVTITATDPTGNTSTCTATITVEDCTDPIANCKSIPELNLDDTGMATIVPADIDDGSTDNCGIESLMFQDVTGALVDSLTFDCTMIGEHEVTLVVTDASGNTSTCTALVNVQDNTPPIAVCQDITLSLSENGAVCLEAPEVLDGGSTDNCKIASMDVDVRCFTCDDIGENTVVLTVIDTSENKSTCTATVTIVDDLDPMIYCPDPEPLAAQAGCTAELPDYTDAGDAIDNCTVVSVTQDPPAGATVNGTQVVTLTATDQSGNTGTCSFEVYVEDTESPALVCKDAEICLDPTTGAYELTAADVVGSLDDNCDADPDVYIEPSTVTCADAGTTVGVFVIAIDAAGNQSEPCTAVVTVSDCDAPVIECNDTTVCLDMVGAAPGVVVVPVDAVATATDACGAILEPANGFTFDCSQVGPNVVTVTATDPSGNKSTCTAIITVEDCTDPDLSCSDLQVCLDDDGTHTITQDEIVSSVGDNCGIDSVTWIPTTVSCDDLTTPVSVVVTATDVNGNTSTCVSTVYVFDCTMPDVTCNDLTVQLDENGQACITADQVASATDACDADVELRVSPTCFSCDDVATPVVVTVWAMDNSGNSASCTATVTVEDNVAPTAACVDTTVQLDATGNVCITPTMVDGGSSDACGIGGMSVSPACFTCADVGANAVTLTVVDVNGNESSCTAIVTVEDTVGPDAVCTSITVQLDENGTASITPDQVDGGSSDACGIAGMTVNPNTFDCTNVGPNPVLLTVTDVNGNASECEAIVTVEDNVAPSCVAQDITIQLDDSGAASITPDQVDGGSSDACGIRGVDASPLNFTCDNIGANTVTLTVIDNNGNTSTCEATVTVEDNVDPVAVCQDITVTLDETGNATITGEDVNGNSTDNCGIASYSVEPNAFTCADIGTVPVVLTVTDTSGNTATCDATVTVTETVPPTCVAQDTTVVLDETTGTASITIDDVLVSVSDNCTDPANIRTSIDITDFDCEDLAPPCGVGTGTVVVTITVWDESGNSGTCTANVTVLDPAGCGIACQDGTVVLDANGQATIDAEALVAFASPCLVPASYSADPATVDCLNSVAGANTVPVTVTMTDVSGATFSCTATVTVIDDQIPEITNCHPDGTVQCNDVAGYSLADWDPMVEDNCDTAYLYFLDDETTPLDPPVVPFGIHTVTIVASDLAGNTTECMFEIVVLGDIREPFRIVSNPALDGGLLEAQPAGSGVGSNFQTISNNMFIGDQDQNRQQLGVVSFNTAVIPADAVLTSARVRLTVANWVGDSSDLGEIVLEQANPSFGLEILQVSDFEAPATVTPATYPAPYPLLEQGASSFYELTPEAIADINRTGTTQFRVKFTTPTNWNDYTDAIVFGTGEYGPDHPWSPEFIIEWTEPECLGCEVGAVPEPDTSTTYEMVFNSVGPLDGYVKESHHTSGVGEEANNASTTFNVGDAEFDKQMIGILPFDTSALPTNATIVSATLQLTRAGKIGDATNGLGNLVMDLRCPTSPDDPYYGEQWGVDLADLQAYADFSDAGTGLPYPTTNFSIVTFDIEPSAFDGIAKGVGSSTQPYTQVRVRFERPDNGNYAPDYLLFYAGDRFYKPALTVVYQLPAAPRRVSGGDQ